MKCPNCGLDNKETAKLCKKCARDLTVAPAWFPDWNWHMRALGVIYGVLIVMYLSVSFVLRKLPEPYHIRKIAPEMTPWLKH